MVTNPRVRLTYRDYLALPESEGMYFASPNQDYGNNVNESTSKNWSTLLQSYRGAYGEDPTSPYMAHAYDATTLLLRAIDQVAVENAGTLYIDRAKIRQALSDTTNYEGIIGAITCDQFGDCGINRVDIRHHTDSSVTDVSAPTVVFSSP